MDPEEFGIRSGSGLFNRWTPSVNYVMMISGYETETFRRIRPNSIPVSYPCNVLRSSSSNQIQEEDVLDFRSSCASLVSSLADDPALVKIASIEDLTKSLREFGADVGKDPVRDNIFSELDQLIGDFLELSGQQGFEKERQRRPFDPSLFKQGLKPGRAVSAKETLRSQ